MPSPSQPLGLGPRTGRHSGKRAPARVLVRGDVLFYPSSGQPQELASLTHTFDLVPDEEPVGRTVTVGPGWEPILKNTHAAEWNGLPSLLCVESLVATERTVIPTLDERKADAALTIELAVQTEGQPGALTLVPFAVVRPGRSHCFEPTSEVFARCPGGKAKARVGAMPPPAPTDVHPGLATMPSTTVESGVGFASGGEQQ